MVAMFGCWNFRRKGREDLTAVIEAKDREILAVIEAKDREISQLKAEIKRAQKESQTVMSYLKEDNPLKIGDLLPSQRQHSAIQFRRSSYEIFAKLKRDGFIVLELPTVDKDKLSSA